MKVYIITQHEVEGSIGFRSDFEIEGFLSLELAKTRLAVIEREKSKFDGLYYTIEEIHVNTHCVKVVKMTPKKQRQKQAIRS